MNRTTEDPLLEESQLKRSHRFSTTGRLCAKSICQVRIAHFNMQMLLKSLQMTKLVRLLEILASL
jgi:hypothetical protein